MPGPPPKPDHLRQRTNKKAGATELPVPPSGVKVPKIPNPDKRKFHALTQTWWKNLWSSPMATQFLPSDLDALGMLAILTDDYFKTRNHALLSEIRLQRQCFGLTPLDRTRLQWTFKGDDVPAPAAPSSEKKQGATASRKGADPRGVLRAV